MKIEGITLNDNYKLFNLPINKKYIKHAVFAITDLVGDNGHIYLKGSPYFQVFIIGDGYRIPLQYIETKLGLENYGDLDLSTLVKYPIDHSLNDKFISFKDIETSKIINNL